MNQPALLTRVKTIGVLTALLVLVSAAKMDGNLKSVLAGAQGGHDEVRIELTSNGFAPNEVQHAPGTFAIAVENSALSGSYTLRLKAEDGTVLKEIEVQKGSAAWTITLQAGQYTLTESSHPEWLCRITLQ